MTSRLYHLKRTKVLRQMKTNTGNTFYVWENRTNDSEMNHLNQVLHH